MLSISEHLDKPGLNAGSADVFAMGNLYVALVDLGINHGGIDALMSKQLLNLLDGHSLINGHGRKGAAEFMRVDFRDVQLPAKFAKPNFNPADLQSGIGT